MVELPTGSGWQASLWQAAAEVSRRLTGSLARAKEIHGELLMIFGTKDPHVPMQDAKRRRRIRF